jgi:PAS domain S-box-containing protein
MADNKMTQLLDLVFSGVYLVDTQRKITYWNKGAEKITGYTPAEVAGRFCPENFLMHVNEEGKFLCHDG